MRRDESRDEVNYWLTADSRPKPVVDLHAARCPRCPQPIGAVPLDRVWLTRRTGHGCVRTFVCPTCRADVRAEVDVREALRLLAAGVRLVRRRVEARPLDEEGLIAFGKTLATTDEVAPLVLDAEGDG